MTTEYRYTGPDGERIADQPAGTGAAVGSEYCVHLLPRPGMLAEALAAAAERGVPLLLLTPYFRDAELNAAMGLFRSIPEGADVDVAVNDWGALLAVRALFPRLRLSVGRLLSGQKRCPRIERSPRLTAEGRRWHGEGLFSSPRAVAFLREAYGVEGYHVDRLEWGAAARAERFREAGAEAKVLYVHEPHAIVTVEDACPWIGGKSSASVSCCSRPCREGSVVLSEPSMGREMVQRGKARFVRYGTPAMREGDDVVPCRRVRYDELP